MKTTIARAALIRAVLVSAAILGAVWTSACAPSDSGLPYYETADFTPLWQPPKARRVTFSLTDQRGRAFTAEDLLGQVHVVSFLYTRCSVICPALVSSLRRVQEHAGNGLIVLSFSVTPELDSPEVLASFAHERGIDAQRWKLLTGPRSEIYRLAKDVYFAADNGLRATLLDPTAVLHTEKLVLVDGSGRMRGVYDGTLPRDVEHLVEDATRLTGGV